MSTKRIRSPVSQPSRSGKTRKRESRECTSKDSTAFEEADTLSRLCGMDNNTEHINLIDGFQVPQNVKDKSAKAHNEFVGHSGLERTLNKLLSREQPWPQIRRHVKWFISHSPCCQLMSCVKYPIHTHPFIAGSYEPFERIHIDTIGPLPVDDDGNAYIIINNHR
jgi:hypothetical protein